MDSAARTIFQDTVEEMIQACGLNDIKPKKGRFTWSNNRVGPTNITVHLDRSLFIAH